MSKLYVSCIVVALLALAVMPAMADEITGTGTVANEDWANVTVTATVPEYINLDAADLDIAFGTLTMPNTGYVEAVDTASFTISTNMPLWVVYANGEDLAETGGHELDLAFSTAITGWWDWGGGMYLGAGESTPWGGCGDTIANDASGLLEDTGEYAIRECQALNAVISARLYQDGINDPAGAYTQDPKQLLTLYTADPSP